MAVYPVIMCGGSGTRLWPMSRPERPKQFLPLTGPRSMFQDAALRVSGMQDVARLVVVAGRRHAEAIRAQLDEIGLSAVLLLEPEARDSAPAMAAACAWIVAHDPTGVAVVVAADHHMPDPAGFQKAGDLAAAAARRGWIVTLGVRPTLPSTAYGYISPGEVEAGPVRRVAAFVEKPDAARAEAYMSSGYLWNSGNFVVAAQTLLGELDRHSPDVSAAARKAVAEADEQDGAVRLGDSFLSATKISIDYAVMERTDRAAVLPVDFAWSDLGAWDAVWAASERDAAGNSIRGDGLVIESERCLVRGTPGLQLTLIGARDLAVVADQGQVLICDLSASQSVKTAVDRLKADGREGPLSGLRPFSTVAEAADWFDVWLRTSALPLWWALGADLRNGGFHEALSAEGAPVAAPRRARVQTRQVFVYASAGLMGWDGPWREAAWHGMDYFLAHYRRPDGLFRARVHPDGAPAEEQATLYDQAFALMAMATLHRAAPGHRDLEREALDLMGALERLRHGAGGFREVEPHSFQANAHMHLLEAALAWIEASGAPVWTGLAEEIATLATERFIDRDRGLLREFFDENWSPAPGDDGRLIEPGHQFEWAWLLDRQAALGRKDLRPKAERLYACGLRGVDPRRGVAVDALWDDLTVRDARARLWPQTEYLKAAAVLSTEDAPVVAAANALRLYLSTPAVGAWRDQLTPDGRFVTQPAPASSFYHIMVACQELAGRARRSA